MAVAVGLSIVYVLLDIRHPAPPSSELAGMEQPKHLL
jgi:xanthosine utilization system XapX-like protein